MRALAAAVASPAGRAGATVVPDCFGIPATDRLTSPGTLAGTNGDDVLVGSAGKGETFNGFNDGAEVRGGSGADLLRAGGNNQTLNGGAGSAICEVNGWIGIVIVACETQLP